MNFGNSELSDWMYVYRSEKEEELGDISWFIFDKTDLPKEPTIVDAIAATVVTLQPVTINGKIESWMIYWEDERLAKLYWEREPAIGIDPAVYFSRIDDVKKDVDAFLTRMSNLIIFA